MGLQDKVKLTALNELPRGLGMRLVNNFAANLPIHTGKYPKCDCRQNYKAMLHTTLRKEEMKKTSRIKVHVTAKRYH